MPRHLVPWECGMLDSNWSGHHTHWLWQELGSAMIMGTLVTIAHQSHPHHCLAFVSTFQHMGCYWDITFYSLFPLQLYIDLSIALVSVEIYKMTMNHDNDVTSKKFWEWDGCNWMCSNGRPISSDLVTWLDYCENISTPLTSSTVNWKQQI